MKSRCHCGGERNAPTNNGKDDIFSVITEEGNCKTLREEFTM